METAIHLKYRYYIMTIGLAFLFIVITRQSNIDAVTNIHGDNYFRGIGKSLLNTILCESHNLLACIIGIHLIYVIKSRNPGLRSYRFLPRNLRRIIFIAILFVMLYSLMIPFIKGNVYKLDYIDSYYQDWYFYFTVLLYGFCYFIGIKIILNYLIRYIEFGSLNDSFALSLIFFSARVPFYLILVFSNKIFEMDKIILL